LGRTAGLDRRIDVAEFDVNGPGDRAQSGGSN
jgi:hypothetical protein